MVGLGIDIIEIERVASAIKKNDRFLERMFTENERLYFSDKNNKMESIAGVFAAKEAVAKVLGTGISGFKWIDIEIQHKDTGQPYVILHNGAAELAENKAIKEIFISISHCKTYAVANAMGV